MIFLRKKKRFLSSGIFWKWFFFFRDLICFVFCCIWIADHHSKLKPPIVALKIQEKEKHKGPRESLNTKSQAYTGDLTNIQYVKSVLVWNWCRDTHLQQTVMLGSPKKKRMTENKKLRSPNHKLVYNRGTFQAEFLGYGDMLPWSRTMIAMA